MKNSDRYVRLNLASAIFPFYTEASGRTIMVPGDDENFDRYNAANTTPDKGVPQVFYMHNVMPLDKGFQSIGYIQQQPGLIGHTDFDTCFPLRTASGDIFFFVPAAGLNYIYDGNIDSWTATTPLPGAVSGNIAANILVTTAFVKGVTYIFYSGIGCFTYNSATKSLDSVTLSGLSIDETLGVCEANGYMIAWSRTDVAWSSLTDPTNFVPSIQTGAGGGSVQDAKGIIQFCVSIPGGFLIYCKLNVVGASFTGNTAFPYTILEVQGSGGVNSINDVAYQGNLPYQVAMTSAGIQQVSLNSAIPTMPELSEFLTSQLFEDFDETTFSFSQQFIGGQLSIKFSSVSNRFIVISYGVSSSNYTHAVLFDIELNRYGKLKIDHRSVFSFVDPAPYGIIPYSALLTTPISTLANVMYEDMFTTMQLTVNPKQNLAFLQADGTTQLVDFQVSEQNSNGIFIIGKFQYVRGNVIVHQRTDVETINLSSSFTLHLLPTFDGKDFAPAVATVENAKGNQTRTYAKRFTASNISLCFAGAFNLTSAVFNFTVGGTR